MARRGVLILLLLQAAAFWPVWGWAASRVGEGDAEEVVALIAAAAALLTPSARDRASRHGAPEGVRAAGGRLAPVVPLADSLRPSPGGAGMPLATVALSTSGAAVVSTRLLLFPTLLTFVYALAVALAAPPLLRAMVAACALLGTWCAWRWNARPHPAALGLALLALPALPTAQFVLGFPLRAAAGEIAARMLQLCGLAVVREGVSLRLGERLVAIDAPCSGVNMLWMAVLLALVLAALGGASTPRTALLVTTAAVLAVAGNALRAASLFFAESGVIALPAGVRAESVHGALGVVAFAIAAGPVVWMALRSGPAVARAAWRAERTREPA